jgi:hypothetical protein
MERRNYSIRSRITAEEREETFLPSILNFLPQGQKKRGGAKKTIYLKQQLSSPSASYMIFLFTRDRNILFRI